MHRLICACIVWTAYHGFVQSLARGNNKHKYKTVNTHAKIKLVAIISLNISPEIGFRFHRPLHQRKAALRVGARSASLRGLTSTETCVL